MKNEYKYKNIRGLHLELTTNCNAMCPMCNRNYKGKVREKLPLTELSIGDIKRILPKEFILQLRLISLCGVYGEPICNKDLKEIIEYFYECNPDIEIDLYTNGSIQSTTWWEDLADIMSPHKGTVIFGIDGDENTHHLHRCNTDYNKILDNAKAYINKGGIACWDYIVFKHNQDTVEEARKLSEELGFKEFQVKKTSRFLKNFYEIDKALDSTILEYGKHPVFDSNGNMIYQIELPTKDEYRNKSEIKYNELLKKYKTIKEYLDIVKIDCSAIKTNGIFISAEGEAFPCCSVYQQVCYKTIHDVKDKDELNEYNLYKNDDLSCFNKSIEEITNGSFFQKLFESFNCKSISEGKPKCCSRTCGKEIDYHDSAHTKKIKYKE